MTPLLSAARALLMDFASTILFFGIYAITDNIVLAVALGVALAVGQIPVGNFCSAGPSIPCNGSAWWW